MKRPEARVVIWRDGGGQLSVSLGFIVHEDESEVVLASTWGTDGPREVFTRNAVEGGQECDLNVSLSFLKIAKESIEEKPNEVPG